jgi:hypothetical protein
MRVLMMVSVVAGRPKQRRAYNSICLLEELIDTLERQRGRHCRGGFSTFELRIKQRCEIRHAVLFIG